MVVWLSLSLLIPKHHLRICKRHLNIHLTALLWEKWEDTHTFTEHQNCFWYVRETWYTLTSPFFSLPEGVIVFPNKLAPILKPIPIDFSAKESTCQCRRYRFNPWVGKIPWRRKWQLAPVFLPGKLHGQRSLVGYSLQNHTRVRRDFATTTPIITPIPICWLLRFHLKSSNSVPFRPWLIHLYLISASVGHVCKAAACRTSQEPPEEVSFFLLHFSHEEGIVNPPIAWEWAHLGFIDPAYLCDL